MANAFGSYADVLDPVKIVTQVVGVVKTEDYLRNYCIISQGDSTLTLGDVALVTSATYQEILRDTTGKDSDLEKAIKGYFATQGQFCYVLEVGQTTLSNPIKAQVDIIEKYINLHPKKMYMYRVPSSWYYPDEDWQVNDTDAVALMLSPTTITMTPSDDTTTSKVELTILTNGELTFKWADGYDTYFTWDANTYTITAIAGKTETDKAYTLEVTATKGDADPVTTTITCQIAATANIDGTFNENFELTRDLAFIQLTAQHTDQHFIITSQGELPEVDNGWALIKGKENVMVVYDNSNQDANGFPLDTAIMGIMGSTKYDISTTNGLTPLNNKSMSGIAYKDLGYTTGEKLIQAPQNIMGDFASNTVLFNGLFADGRSFEFRYAIDFMNYQIDLALKRLLYNSANVTSYVLKYDQNGIDTIDATIRAVLENLKDMNVVNTYAASFNTTTNKMVNENFINCIDFYTYKAAYPANYAAGIYGGVSFYVLIQGFIKEINLNITIE